MRAGNLRTLARIQRLVESGPDAMGATTTQWTDVGNVYIDAQPMSGRELLMNQKVTGQIMYGVVMRYRTDIDATMRLVFGRTILQIASPPMDPTGRRAELKLVCESIQ
jgi:SPP1 family predicted phage head-tail adaptor